LCLLAVLVLWLFGRNLNWGEVSEAIRRADWRLIAAAVVVVWLTYMIRAFRWKALLAPLAPDASLREIFAATTVGFSAVFLVGRTGEVVRPAFLPLRDPKVRPGAAFVTIAVERIYDTVAVVVLFAANLLIFQAPKVAATTLARVREAGLLLLVLRAFGLLLGVSETVFVLGWSLVGSLVPTPGGGAGTYHAATAYGLTAFLGVAETEAKAATIVLHLVVFGSSLFFGIYYFLRSGVSFARLRSLTAPEASEGTGARPAHATKEDLNASEARA